MIKLVFIFFFIFDSDSINKLIEFSIEFIKVRDYPLDIIKYKNSV